MLVLSVVFLPHEAVIAAFTPLAVLWIVTLALAPWKADPEPLSDRARRARTVRRPRP